jgi:hypothetical protein
MKLLTIISFLLISLSGLAEYDQRLIAMPFNVIADSVNKNLSPNEAKFSFQIFNEEFQNPPFSIIIKTSVNGVWKEITLDEYGRFEFAVEPGTYKFQFYVNQIFSEIISQEVEIRKQHETTVRLIFHRNYYYPEGIMVDKPVIYFHTSEERTFDLSVKPAGNFTFVYPEMKDSWKGAAKPNGEIAIEGVNYPYLFWESSQQYSFHYEGNGYKVEKPDIVSFLHKKLTELGLNQREQTDFITYWGPKLAANESSFVQFSVDESCGKFAEMNCIPRPESVRRVYIQIAKWDPYFEMYLKDVAFSPVQPGNWYLIEWGGFSFSLPNVALNEN